MATKVKRSALIKTVKAMNETLDLVPKLSATTPTNKLITNICEASECITDEHTFDDDVLETLEAIGARVPGDPPVATEEPKEEVTEEKTDVKEEVTEEKTDVKEEVTEEKTEPAKPKTAAKPPKDDGMEGTKITKGGSKKAKAKPKKTEGGDKPKTEKKPAKPKKEKPVVGKNPLGYRLGSHKECLCKQLAVNGPQTMAQFRDAEWNPLHQNHYNNIKFMIMDENVVKEGKEFKLTDSAIETLGDFYKS